MATQHNFRIKNGLEVAGTERISSAGAITPQSLTVTADAGIGGNLTVTGNLIVNGSTTTINTATLSVEDLNITVASGAGNSSAANGAGLTIAGASAIFAWNHAQGAMTLNKELRLDNNKGLFFHNATGNSTLGFKADTSDNITFRQNGQWDRLVIKNDGVDIAGNIYTANSISSGTTSTLKGYFYESTVDQNGTGKPSSVLGLAAKIDARSEGPSIDFNAIWGGGGVYQQDNWNEGWTVGRIAGVYDLAGLDTGALAFYTQTSGSSGGASSSSLTEKMRIKSSGSVGIGTSSPSAILEVVQPSSGAAIIARTNESSASQRAGGGFSSFGSSTAANRIAHFWLDADGANFAGSDYFYIHKKGNGGEAALIQQNNADLKLATSGTTRITINGTGQVGIGSAPDSDIGLSIHKGGAIGLKIKSDGQQGYTQGAISIESSVNTDSPAGRGQGVYMFNEANDITWYTGTLYDNASTYGISYKSGSTLQAAAADNGNAGVFMVIKNNGNVGIGTNNPTVGKLHVAGGIYSTTSIQGDNAVAKSSNSLATFGSNSASVGIALARDADATTYPDLVITSAGAVTVGSQGNVIGAKWLSSHENLYWNSKFIYSGGGYGSAPDKWITQGGNVTITSEHPFNKGFSTLYTPTQGASHTTNINNATPSTPHWKGTYTTFSGATNFGGNQNSSLGGGWENGEGAIMKCVYNGSGASGSTNAVRAYIWKNFFSAGKVHTRQSFFYFLESGEFSSGYFAGYGGQYGSDYTHGSTATESATGQHRHTTTGQWVYVNHACGSYLGATFNNSSQNYMHGFGFRPGYATTVWIAVPGLTAQVRDDGKTINMHSAQQQIGQG